MLLCFLIPRICGSLTLHWISTSMAALGFANLAESSHSELKHLWCASCLQFPRNLQNASEAMRLNPWASPLQLSRITDPRDNLLTKRVLGSSKTLSYKNQPWKSCQLTL